MINNLLSLQKYHLNIKLDNPCLIDDKSIECCIYKNFFLKEPTQNIFYLNYEYFLNNPNTFDIVNFDIRWVYDPYKCSYDIYGSKYYAPLIMFFNNVPSIFLFHPRVLNISQLKIPKPEVIKTLCQQ